MSDVRVAVVTGGARGIGRGIALMLAEPGTIVHVTDRDGRDQPHPVLPGTVEDTAEDVTARGGTGIAHVIDHTDDEAVAALFAELGEQHGGVDLVVANAFDGNALPFAPAPFWELPMVHWQNMIDAGLRSHLATARNAAPLLIARRGLFVMTGYAVTESAGHVFYDLAMNGISRLATALSHDLAPHGVTALTLSPGFTSTEAIRAAFGDTPLPPGVDTVEHVGNTVRALWNDPNIGALSGQTVTVAELAERYRLTPDGQETTP